MTIIDKFGKYIVIYNPKFIPRIGERIVWKFYSPYPTVKDITYDFDSDGNLTEIVLSVD